MLASYMTPSSFVPLNRISLTTSGKVDRKRLRAMVASLTPEQLASLSSPDASPLVSPSTVIILLATAWAETLSREYEKISTNDNFIRLGGDSLAAIRLVTVARGKKIELTVSMIFQNCTLAELAQAAKQIASSEDGSVQPFELLPDAASRESTLLEVQAQCKVPPEMIKDILPATPLQDAMFK